MSGSTAIVTAALERLRRGMVYNIFSYVETALLTLRYDTPWVDWGTVKEQLKYLRSFLCVPDNLYKDWITLEQNGPDWGD